VYYHDVDCSRDQIDRFIDDNKALMKRMYGEFEMSTEYGPRGGRGGGRRGKRGTVDDDLRAQAEDDGGSYFAKLRKTRQSLRDSDRNSETGR